MLVNILIQDSLLSLQLIVFSVYFVLFKEVCNLPDGEQNYFIFLGIDNLLFGQVGIHSPTTSTAQLIF